MKICFLHPGSMTFDVETPYRQPLGGTESALVYVAVELAALKLDVTLLCNVEKEDTQRGVHVMNYTRHLSRAFFSEGRYDFVVMINGARLAEQVREMLPDTTRLWLWITLDVDQPPLAPLMQKSVRALWDGYVAVSEMHRLRLISHLHLEKEKCRVLRNAISPAFENQFANKDEMAQVKRTAGVPLMAYTSTPFRGLEQLLDIYPRFSNHFPDARLRVYSSMQVYQKTGGENEKWLEELYERCRTEPGVEYIGSVPQPALASALRETSILAYPSTFWETSCIAVMEAMASGCLVVTSDYGALGETSGRFAQLVPVSFRSLDEFLKEYFNALVSVYVEFYSHPDEMMAHLWEEVGYANAEFTWRARAQDWLDALDGGAGRQA